MQLRKDVCRVVRAYRCSVVGCDQEAFVRTKWAERGSGQPITPSDWRPPYGRVIAPGTKYEYTTKYDWPFGHEELPIGNWIVTEDGMFCPYHSGEVTRYYEALAAWKERNKVVRKTWWQTTGQWLMKPFRPLVPEEAKPIPPWDVSDGKVLPKS